MSVDTQFLVQMLIYSLSFGVFYGTTTIRLKNLEQKMDKHNNVIERIYSLEEHSKSMSEKINEINKKQSSGKH